MLNKLNKSNYTLWLSVLGIIIIIVIAAAAIADRATHPSKASTIPTTAAGPTTPQTGVKIGDIAPDFNLQTIDNRMISLYEYRGKNIILNFWATWCGPCRYEASILKEIDETWAKSGIVIIAVSTQDNIENATKYARGNNLNFIIPLDPRGEVASMYNVFGLPTSFFIDSMGVIKSIKVGPFVNKGEVEERMKTFK